MRTSVVALTMLLAVLVGLSSARYLPTKRGSDSERLDRLAHLIKELLAESDAAPVEHSAYDQRVFYKREAPYKLSDLLAPGPAPGPAPVVQMHPNN